MKTQAGTRDEEAEEARTNRLAEESSPYLRQHAHNPVDWYPWGAEALRRAREESKPIFLSIGYAACHWCHVMERESFENPAVAAVLNEHFVSIKVDREQRPDVDEIYMTAVQMMTGSGGWPLTVFLTPELEPFFGGTYFPPEDRYGRPGFKRVLEHIAGLWGENPDGVRESARSLTGALRDAVALAPAGEGGLDASLTPRAARELAAAFDRAWGGFGEAPKFPPSGAITLLLREYARTGDEGLLRMATTTLDRMARGGMYDQIGGGFHRYSTDERWLVPHFEKMLYDNALLARAYLEAWQIAGKELYRRVAAETLDYLLRDMSDRGGGFHSSEDADSEGEEGVFYVWGPDEVSAVLGEEDGELFCATYGVTEAGNFEGQSILNLLRAPEETASERGIPLEELEERLAPLREKLLRAREGRVRPGKDDKILAAWNGMAISALARGQQVLGDERYGKAAARAADFVLTGMLSDGRLLRSHPGAGSPGAARRIPGFLDDYAEMINGLVDLYEATFDPGWLEAADQLCRRMLDDFWDEERGGFFYTSADHTDLLVRTKPYHDGAVPSGNSTAAVALLRLSRLFESELYRQRAEATIGSASALMRSRPSILLNMISAADRHLLPSHEVVIAGEADGEDTKRLLEVVRSAWIPNRTLALAEPGGTPFLEPGREMPLLEGRRMISGRAAAYVCEDLACQRPVTEAAELEELLREIGTIR